MGGTVFAKAASAIAYEQDILPSYLPKARWFGAKGRHMEGFGLVATGELTSGDGSWLLSVAEARISGGERQRYFLPLAITWEQPKEDVTTSLLPFALGRARRGPRTGLIHDAFVDGRFVLALIEAVREGRTIAASPGELRFVPTRAIEKVTFDQVPEVRRLNVEQSNTSVIIGDYMVVKGYRKLEQGIHLELEVARFLTEKAGFSNTPPLLGAVEHVGDDGASTALCIVQGFVRNQGSGWDFTLHHLERMYENEGALQSDIEAGIPDLNEVYFVLAETLGVRTGELHRAFALNTGDPAFDPEPITVTDLRAWTDQVRTFADDAMTVLQQGLGNLRERDRELAESVLARRGELLEIISSLAPERVSAVKTRYHGDYHLGQVLIVQDDWHIIDFEGEPLRSLAERREKHTPLKDVAGMLRSIDYAAWAALFRQTTETPEHLEELRPLAEEWQARTVDAYLRGYDRATEGCRSRPEDDEHMQALLDLFIIEKAAYEVRYEVGNRPTWVRIPLLGLSRILSERSS